ncbi:MAG TPA: PQQ-dependent sugar dehydrogenase [Polyangiaceae bacterium]
MTVCDKRVPRMLALLSGFCALGVAGLAQAQLVAPFATAIDVDPQYVNGATGATDIAWAADGRAVVTTRGGTIVVRQANGTTVQRSGVFSNVSSTLEQGLLGVVADPSMANRFFFYVSNGTDAADRHRVFRGVLNADNTFTIDMTPIIAASRNLGTGLQGPANHNGGGMVVYQDRLYVGVGDTGQNATPPTNKYSSCLNRPNGKILRVALDGTIPMDNPLADVTSVTACDDTGRSGGAWTTAAPDRRIFAWGFRNPWRFWVDPMSGRLWVGDVGETTREEISVGTGDSHFGYPFFEGNQDWSMSGGSLRLQKTCNMSFEPSRPCTAAVHDYDNNTVGNCVIGGLIPDGCGWQTALGGTLYLFADNGPGWIRALTVTNRMMGTASSTATTVGTFANTGPASIRMGPDESLYVVMNRGNSVYRFTPRDRTGCAGMGGMGGAGGIGAGGRGGSSGSGGMSGGIGGQGATAGVGTSGSGTGGASGGQGGTSDSGGSSAGGAAGAGVSGSGQTTGGAPSGGAGGSGGAPVGGGPGAGVGATGTSGTSGDDGGDGGCGCRVSSASGAGYLALALGLLAAFVLRVRRRGGD